MPFLLALGLGAVLTPLAALLGARLGLVDRPDGGRLKVHPRPVPLTGGLAVLASAAMALALLGGLPSPWSLAAVAVALGVGTADDRRPVPPWPRLLGLALAGALAAVDAPLEALGSLAPLGTVLLVVACANGANLLDGQDGLAGGLAALAALGLALVGSLASWGADVHPGLALAGALLGFLVWNRPPARVFLGNGGAYAVGTWLALVVAGASEGGGWHALLACGVVLGVFAFELASTVARRVATRTSLASGDRDHSYDMVAAALGSRGRATAAFLVAGGVAAGLGGLAAASGLRVTVAVGGAGAVLAGLWGVRLWRHRVPQSP
ncbi:MAG TPA: hypothetical protein VNO34_00565 [Actinomycetota bacterium]|nr:hypothetical protein [Actinomycetota bacterium]